MTKPTLELVVNNNPHRFTEAWKAGFRKGAIWTRLQESIRQREVGNHQEADRQYREAVKL